MRLKSARLLDFECFIPYIVVKEACMRRQNMKKLCKIESEGKISGVCAGLGRYLNIDVTIIRIIFLIMLFMGVGSPVLIYIVLAIVMPEYDPNAVEFEEVEEDEEVDEYDFEDRYK